MADATLDIAFQPIVAIHSGRVHGYEALARNTERLGFPSALELLDTAAGQGILEQMNALLLTKAITKFTQLKRRNEILYLNLDPRVFQSEADQFETVERCLAQSGLGFCDVCIEISEKHNSVSSEEFFAKHKRWKAQGMRFAIDDFGQGYSGLRALYDIIPDVLKIDRFFISDIQSDSKKRLFVSTVVDLAHVLGIKVLAEGVETPAEVHVCREIGCDLLQGFYISRPTVELSQLSRVSYPIGPSRRNQRGAHQVAVEAVLSAVERLPAVSEASSMKSVLTILERNALSTCIPVVDKHGHPRGIIREVDMRRFLYLPFGKDLLRNKSCTLSIATLMKSCPVVDVNADLSNFISLIADGVDVGVIVTKDMKYFGFVNAPALVRIANTLRLLEKDEVNAITGLPSHGKVRAFLEDAIAATWAHRTVCYFDFGGFRSFNERFGFRAGDRVIKMFSELLRKLFREKYFLGHLGGDEFMIGRISPNPVDVAAKILELQRQFSANAELFCRPTGTDLPSIVPLSVSLPPDAPGLSCRAALVELQPGEAIADSAAFFDLIDRARLNARQEPTEELLLARAQAVHRTS